jgi:predicted Zn-dependent peptidase
VPLNKEEVSPFHQKIVNNKVDKLQPVFLDFEKDITKLKMNKDVEVLYTPNDENDLFTLYYLSDVGTNNNPKMNAAVEYLQYIGTEDMNAEELQKEFYKLGCTFNVFASGDQTYVSLEGLSENMDKSVELFERLLASPKADDEALTKMVEGIFKKRDDQKKDKWAIMFSGLMNYGLYGPKSSFTNVVSNRELRGIKSSELIEIIKDFTKTQHRVLYYGPKKGNELIATLNKYHTLPDQLKPVPPPVQFTMQDVTVSNVYWADYDMVQEEVMFLSKEQAFNVDQIPMARMFNEYFGGNMSSPVFQELREAQGLAYSAFAYYGTAGKPADNDLFYAYIGTQADKQPEAMKAMLDLLQNFPRSENGFESARNAILNQIESQRITKASILFNFESARKKGLNYDVRKDIYEQVQNYTLEDVANFQAQQLKNNKYNIVLLGSKDKINFKDLNKYGQVKQLSLDEIFGYEKPVKINTENPNQ